MKIDISDVMIGLVGLAGVGLLVVGLSSCGPDPVAEAKAASERMVASHTTLVTRSGFDPLQVMPADVRYCTNVRKMRFLHFKRGDWCDAADPRDQWDSGDVATWERWEAMLENERNREMES